MSHNTQAPTSVSTTSDSTNATTAVVNAVAEAEGISPLEITTPLADAIDPDALESLFAPTATGQWRSGEVEFEYHGYHVSLRCDGSQMVWVDLDAVDGTVD